MSIGEDQAFLGGQMIEIPVHRVEAELTRLWNSASDKSRSAAAEGDNVTRVVLANLVVVAPTEQVDRVRATVDQLVARHPSRTILVETLDRPGASMKAEISATCHLPLPGHPQVCSERISLRVEADAARLVPGAIRPLLEANLPTVLWWTDDPRRAPALFHALAADSSRVILDLPDPDTPVEAFGPLDAAELARRTRDASWFAVTRWREMIAQFFDGPKAADHLPEIRSVEIQVELPDALPDRLPRATAWLAAWLAGQLGWRPVEGSRRRAAGPDRIDYRSRFRAGKEHVEVCLAVSTAPIDRGRIKAVTIDAESPAGSTSYRLVRLPDCSNRVRVDESSADSCALPRVVRVPVYTPAERIAAALEASRFDATYERARPMATWLLGPADRPADPAPEGPRP